MGVGQTIHISNHLLLGPKQKDDAFFCVGALVVWFGGCFEWWRTFCLLAQSGLKGFKDFNLDTGLGLVLLGSRGSNDSLSVSETSSDSLCDDQVDARDGMLHKQIKRERDQSSVYETIRATAARRTSGENFSSS